jgi:predicted DNA-binding antitoxin AbrB/MazE fold protein
MTQCTAIYENGVLRPKQPLELPEGAEVQVIVVQALPVSSPSDQRTIAEVFATIAALPMEGKDVGFSGRDHDAVLYPKEGRMP